MFTKRSFRNTMAEMIKTLYNREGDSDKLKVKSEVDTEAGTTNNLDDSVSSDGDSVENVYADYEPEETYEVDVMSGKSLLPLNEKLRDRQKYYDSHGMYASYTTPKVSDKVEEMKQRFLTAIQATEYKDYFTSDDDWVVKGSSAEGSLFPMICEHKEEDFMKEILGDSPDNKARQQLQQFLEKQNQPEKIKAFHVKTPDIDIMVSPKTIQVTSEESLKPTKYPAYYNVHLIGDSGNEKWRECFEQIIDSGQISLSPNKIKAIFYNSLCAMSKTFEEEGSAMIVVPHGLAYQISVITPQNEGKVVSAFLYDFAIGINCCFWPSCAREWVTRNRLWPCPDEVQKIANEGVNLMIKSPTGNTTDLLWRVSFARAEYSICRLPLVYWYTNNSWTLMKSFIQNYVCTNKPKILTSYHIKTLYLYALERLPKDYWINGENLLKTIMAMIDELLLDLALHECKHYFMPQVNLLKSTSNSISPDFFPTVAKNLLAIRAEILDDPAEYFFPEKRN